MIVSRGNHADSGVYNMTGIEGACPKGFLFPDNPDDPDNEWINGTLCAVACLSPINSEEYYRLQTFVLSGITWVGSVCIVLLALTMFVTRADRKNYIIYATIFMSALPTLYTLAITFVPQEKHFCRDNTNAITGEDGFYNSCAVQSFINIYSALGLVFVWVLQMWDVFKNVVYGKTEKLVNHKTACCILIYLMPLLPCIVVFNRGHQGYNKGNPTCWTNRASGDFDMIIFLFIFVSAVISLFLFLPVLRNVLLLLSVNVYYPDITHVGPESSTANISLRMPSQYLVVPAQNRDGDNHNGAGYIGLNQAGGDGKVSDEPADRTDTENDCGFLRDSFRNHQIVSVEDRDFSDVELSNRNLDGDNNAGLGMFAGEALGLETSRSVASADTANSEVSVYGLINNLFQLIVRGNARVSMSMVANASDRAAGSIVGVDSGGTGSGHELAGGERNEAIYESENNLPAIITKNKLVMYSLNLTKRLKVLKRTLLFVAAFVICAFGLWIGRLVVYFNSKKSFKYFDIWIECIFDSYFDGYSDALDQGVIVGSYDDLGHRDSYAREVCGEQPEHVTYWVLGVWFFFAAFGNSWFVSAAYLRWSDISRLFFTTLLRLFSLCK